MAYLTDYQYYTNSETNPEDLNWGSYQYVGLTDIINNYLLMYVGNDKIVNNVERHIVRFHAKRGIQELNYDALKEIKIVELSVCNPLITVLPPDYVNWVRISLLKEGVLYPLSENNKTNYAISYLQDNECNVMFDDEGEVLKGTSLLDASRLDGQDLKGRGNKEYADCYMYNIGGRYGVDPSIQSGNPTFSIDKKSGVINFSSDMAGEEIVLEYVSDGMEGGDDESVSLNKFFEQYIYSYITWAILDSKEGVQEYKINRARRNKTANLRNARIRIGNFNPAKLLKSLKAQNKWIK